VHAEAGLLWAERQTYPLIGAPATPAAQQSANTPSLFAGTAGKSLFAPSPHRARGAKAGALHGTERQLLDLIASVEAGRAGYDAVVWAARIKPPNLPTQLTIAEIDSWIAATPGQHHAIGRYQFIPATLERLVAQLDVAPSQRFSPELQDKLALQLLKEAGLEKFNQREMGRVTFMNNLAKIWAGLPNASGRSHYHGIAGNKATITWPVFAEEMAAIYDP